MIRNNILIYLITLITFLIIDGVWLYIMNSRFYAPKLGDIIGPDVMLLPAFIFYLLIALGAVIFIIVPSKDWWSGWMLFWRGGLLGVVAYGTYDLTNQALVANWPTIVTIVDMSWSFVLMGSVCFIVGDISRRYGLLI